VLPPLALATVLLHVSSLSSTHLQLAVSLRFAASCSKHVHIHFFLFYNECFSTFQHIFVLGPTSYHYPTLVCLFHSLFNFHGDFGAFMQFTFVDYAFEHLRFSFFPTCLLFGFINACCIIECDGCSFFPFLVQPISQVASFSVLHGYPCA
jgi:hypothetical protein